MTTTMRSRLHKKINLFSGVLGTVIFSVLVLGILFHGALFRSLSSVAVLFSATTTDEYALVPKKILAARLFDAERELARTQYQAVLYAQLVEENARLQDTLGLHTEDTIAVGRVIARPPRTHYDTFLVALKENHPVAKGDAAFFENTLLGEVVAVGPRSALVSLFSTAGMQVDARVGEPTGIVVLKGLGGGAFTFDVPDEVLISDGSLVVSASQDTDVLAVVDGIVVDPDTTLKKVYAHIPVTFSAIRYLMFTPAQGREL